jgi:hypothetical protein
VGEYPSLVHPIERLRHVARAGDADGSFLAEEAAVALGALAFEPRALVPAARRLLDFHPRCAPLWWVCAELLAADDPAGRSHELSLMLAEDPTSAELAAALPGAATIATSGGAKVSDALVERPDLDVRLVSSPLDLRYQLRRLGGFVDVAGFTDEDLEEALEAATVVLVEVEALSRAGALLDPRSARLVEASRQLPVELWVVAGRGRTLPMPLFEAMRARIAKGRRPGAAQEGWSWQEESSRAFEPDPAEVPQVVELGRVAVVVGPDGPRRPEIEVSRLRCPVPAELLNAASDH